MNIAETTPKFSGADHCNFFLCVFAVRYKYEFASDFYKRILAYFKEHASDEEVLEYFRLPKKDQFKWMMEWNEQ